MPGSASHARQSESEGEKFDEGEGKGEKKPPAKRQAVFASAARYVLQRAGNVQAGYQLPPPRRIMSKNSELLFV